MSTSNQQKDTFVSHVAQLAQDMLDIRYRALELVDEAPIHELGSLSAQDKLDLLARTGVDFTTLVAMQSVLASYQAYLDNGAVATADRLTTLHRTSLGS